MEREMGIEPTSPAWKAGTLPLSYSRAMGPGHYYTRPPRTRPGPSAIQGWHSVAGAELAVLWGRPGGLALAEPALVVEEGAADGDRGPGAVQVRQEGLTDLGVRRQLAEMDPPHPARRDVADQKHPSGEASM